MTDEQKFEVLPNGDVEGTTIYPENKVVITVGGRESEIGFAPSYEVKQVIKKEKIPDLLTYLREQKDYFATRVKKNNEVLEQTEHVDIDKLKGEFVKLPLDSKPKMAKLKGLDQLAEQYHMKSSALKNGKVLQDGLDKIQEQIDFLNDLV